MSQLSDSGYDQFARIYDKHWGQPGAQRFFRAVEPHLPDGALDILDLCCGTGRLAKILLQQGHNVWGVDLSEQMIRLAKKNAPEGTFEVADARDFSLERCFDAATCTFDSLNHLLTDEGLSRALLNVRDHLHPKGVFIFDVNTSRKYERRWEGSFTVEDELSVTATYDRDTCIAKFNGTLQNGEQFELVQRPLDKDVIEAALKRAHFEIICIEPAELDRGAVPLREKYVVFRK